MTLPPDFIFTQNNLQDYEDCPRRFELRYLLRQEWPAPQTEPVIEQERRMALGERFHRLVQQHFLGVPLETLDSLTKDPELADWWHTFLEDPLIQALPSRRWPELTLSMPFSGHRLLCKLDLLTAGKDGKFTILDWKTSSKHSPRPVLASRWQTRLYPYILQHASVHLNGETALNPEQIEMIYWFAEDASHPEHFQFSSEQSGRVEKALEKTIHEIAITPEGRFFLTPDTRRCAFCVYRSLCERGDRAGSLEDADSDYEPPDTEPGLDLDQIGEIIL